MAKTKATDQTAPKQETSATDQAAPEQEASATDQTAPEQEASATDQTVPEQETSATDQAAPEQETSFVAIEPLRINGVDIEPSESFTATAEIADPLVANGAARTAE